MSRLSHQNPMRARTTSQPITRRERGDQHSARREATARGEQRTREAGGPQDHALYACGCGLVFAEAVSTHVTCPECGADQAW